MCDAAAVRVGLHVLAVENTLYVTLDPPEKRGGFIKEKTQNINELLGG